MTDEEHVRFKIRELKSFLGLTVTLYRLGVFNDLDMAIARDYYESSAIRFHELFHDII